MTNQDREQIALFRYALIAPLVNNQVISTTEYLAEMCAKVHEVPYYGRKEFAPKTMQGWLRDYRKGGFSSLKPKGRSDRGCPRVLTAPATDRIVELRQGYRALSATLFYELLVSKGVVEPNKVSYHTVYRFLKARNLLERDAAVRQERKRFAYDRVNILWQGDMSVGCYLVIGGKKLRTNLFAFIDDCSRLVPFAQFSFSEKFDAMKTVLKEALLRRGIPKMIYVDNGKVYHAQQLHWACASLGITLTHTQPYDPESKGKIERFFGTVRRRFYPLLEANPPQSIDELNQRFWRWLEEDYHRRTHSAIEATPLDVFLAQSSSVRMVNNPALLDPLFFQREFRKVNHDATISLAKRLYEVPPHLVGQRVEVRFDPAMPETIYLYEEDSPVFTASPVSFSDNAHVKRNRKDKPVNPISFEELLSPVREEW